MLLGFMLLLSSCTILGGAKQQPTSTPKPTSSVSGLQVVSPQSCQLASQPMIRVDHPQGDLIAWSPVSDTLAYVSTGQGSSWNVGELNSLKAPLFDTPVRLASQVAGEVTWAPDASLIAYLGLRRSDDLYTIGLAYLDGSGSRDLFPGEAARTDDYASKKSILKWTDPGWLSVLLSCGINCLQPLDINVLTGNSTLAGDAFESHQDLWPVHTRQPATIPARYSKLTGQLNWSWDDRHIAYIDDNGYLWLIDDEAGNIYPVVIGAYGTATETDWSYDDQYLAVHVDQALRVYAFSCP